MIFAYCMQVNMLVWPQRMVVPIIFNDKEIESALEAMYYRSQGILKARTAHKCYG